MEHFSSLPPPPPPQAAVMEMVHVSLLPNFASSFFFVSDLLFATPFCSSPSSSPIQVSSSSFSSTQLTWSLISASENFPLVLPLASLTFLLDKPLFLPFCVTFSQRSSLFFDIFSSDDCVTLFILCWFTLCLILQPSPAQLQIVVFFLKRSLLQSLLHRSIPLALLLYFSAYFLILACLPSVVPPKVVVTGYA